MESLPMNLQDGCDIAKIGEWNKYLFFYTGPK
jgi:hypothetical protein